MKISRISKAKISLIYIFFLLEKIHILLLNNNKMISSSILLIKHLAHDVKLFLLVNKFKVPTFNKKNNQLKL